jgi:hypothetical protein
MGPDNIDDEYARPEPPKRGDRLFAQDRPNWRVDAFLDPDHGDDYAYGGGYRIAGKILTE